MKKTLKIAIASLAVTTVAQSAENNNQTHNLVRNPQINLLDQSIFLDGNLNPMSERDLNKFMAQTKADYEDIEMQKILEQSRNDHEELEAKRAIALSLAKKEKKDRQEIDEQLELYRLSEFFEEEERKKQIEADELMALSFLDQSYFFPLELQDHGFFNQKNIENTSINNNSTITNSTVHTNKDVLNSTKAPNLEVSINIESIYLDAGNFLQTLRNNIIAEKEEYGIYSKTLEDIKEFDLLLTDLQEKQTNLTEQLNADRHSNPLQRELHAMNENIKDTERLLKNLNDLKNSPELIKVAEEIDAEFNNIKVKALSEKFKISDKKAQDILDIFIL